MTSATRSEIKVANAPCSWSALKLELSGDPQGYGRVLDEIQASGYAGTELGDLGFMPSNPKRLKAELQKRNLEMLAAFVPVALANPEAHADGVERAVQVASLLAAVAGKPFLVLSDDNCKVPNRHKKAGRIFREDGMTDRQWLDFVAGTHRIAREVLRRTGVRTAFHHHCAGYIETPVETDRFLRLTDPDLIGLCLDTGHYTFGGGDALDAVRKHGKRIQHVHFRDCDPRLVLKSRHEEWDYFRSVNNGVFCELGKGSVPLDAITEELRRIDYNGWIVVEQRVLPGMGTPLAAATRNRKFLQELGL